MLNLLRDWLVQQGLGGQTAAFVTTAVEIALVITLAAIADIVVRRIILRQLKKLVGQTSTVWDDIIVKRRVFHRLLHLAPALVIYVFAQPVLEGYDLWIVVVRRASLIYMLLVTLLAIDGVLNAGVDILRSSKFSRNLPVKVVVQVLKLVLYSVATIALLSLIIGQSPSLLLGGLGAMTAVLMLIFKDSILGLVAGIQLSANQMVAPGDWIEMPKYGADGDVLEVALKRFSNRPCTTWGGRGTSAHTDAGGPMRAYSMDLRERALLDSDAGMKAADVAAKYRVSGSWVRLLKQRRRDTGEVAPRVQRHGRRGMREPHLHTLAALIAAHPDRTLAELKDALATPASVPTVWRAVRALGLTVKKNGPPVRTRSA